MTAYQQNLSEIFEKNEHPLNLELFRKIILLAREGLLQVNGQFPDSSKSLFENLIEGYSFVVDLTQLDPTYRHKLKTWLLDPHQNQCSHSFWEGYVNNDYRGYTVEVALSWWGRFYNWLFGIVETAFWPLAKKKNLSTDFHLHGFSLQTGKQGWLFEFKSTHLDNMFTFKDGDNLEQARNSRRIILTPGIVDKLVKVKSVDDRIYSELNEPHPLSIKVEPHHKAFRNKAMAEFRRTEFIEEEPAWYIRLYYYLKSIILYCAGFFSFHKNSDDQVETDEKATATHTKSAGTKHVLYEKHGIKITKQNGTFKVQEKWPGYSILISSGGGGKIFALVGGYRAARRMGVPFKAFAGSSAGAIMSILAYLDYPAEKVQDFFAHFDKEILLLNDWDKTGYSKTTALKAALDYAIALKVSDIIKTYQIDQSEEGRQFLNNEVFNLGKITFRSLAKLKHRYPNCGIKNNLIIPASNIESQRTEYFSLNTTPDMEVSLAGELSASIPPLFKPKRFNGDRYTDAGLTTNFPVEAFIGHDKSFLSSRYGYSIESMGFCFDNGKEEGMLNRFRQKIYREPALANWFYQFISGIQDPVSAWEWDRIKMVQQSFTTVLLHADVPSTQFNIDETKQNDLIDKGDEETERHLKYLYSKNKETGEYQSSQLMYETFPSMEAILVHCCFRQNKEIFDELVPIARQHGISQNRIDILSRRFDTPDETPDNVPNGSSPQVNHQSKFKQSLSKLLISRGYIDRMRFFIYLYPIFLRLREKMFVDKKDYALFCVARHGTSVNNPLYALPQLKKLSNNQHLVLYIAMYCLKNYQYNRYDDICQILQKLSDAVVSGKIDLSEKKMINNWSGIMSKEGMLDRLLESIRQENWFFMRELVEKGQSSANKTTLEAPIDDSQQKQFNCSDEIKSCVC